MDTQVKITLRKELVQDVKNIARGVYAPLKGFLGKEDFDGVLADMRLKNGEVWSIPIVLDVDEKEADRMENEDVILLEDEEQRPIARLKHPETFLYDKEYFVQQVFGTTDSEHPGVEEAQRLKKYLVGGEIELLEHAPNIFPEYNLSPAETRAIFQERGWKTVVAFQTRNVPHRGHEFLQKYALESVDGLFVQPVIGEKKVKDFKDEYIVATYEIVLDRYYPSDRVLLGILPLRMRYAGPREAVMHALIRKNFGCTHFIVGRDHAGVGSYYSPYAAQEIFDTFQKEEIGIEILKYPEVVYNSAKQKHMFIGEVPEKDQVSFSGSQLREYINEKKQPPTYLIRPEVYYLLANSANSLVDDMYKDQGKGKQKSFVLWFTGFSQAGKTTLGNTIHELLKEKGMRTERLDGDIVREYLAQDLGFSKEDRDENIKRVTFISKLLSRNGIGVVASFISPYRAQREELRKEVQNFIEVFCDCPLEVCESRDDKGLYKKARAGEITNFTGISDPYEEPEHPEIHVHTDQETVTESVEIITRYLEDRGFL